jgi:hypothetical protein
LYIEERSVESGVYRLLNQSRFDQNTAVSQKMIADLGSS